MCREGCPISTSIPEVIHTFPEGDIDSAGEMLFANNSLSVICSLICSHENRCEGHCVLGRKGAPVYFSNIENYISDNYFEKLDQGAIEVLEAEKGRAKGRRVGVIGGGSRNRIVSTTKGIDVNDRGLLVTNTFGRTTRDGIFAAGDVVLGARTVVEAVNYSKQVAQAMDEYLCGLPEAESSIC